MPVCACVCAGRATPPRAGGRASERPAPLPGARLSGSPSLPSRSPSSGSSIWATFSRRSRVTARARRGLAVAVGAAAGALSSGCPAGPQPRCPLNRRHPGAGTASSAGPACSASSCTVPARPPPPAQRRSRRSRRRRRRGTGPTLPPPPPSTWRGATRPWPPRTAPLPPAASCYPRPPPPQPLPPRLRRPPPAAKSWGWLRPPPGSSRAEVSSWPAWGRCASWGRPPPCSSSGGRHRRRPSPLRPPKWCASGRGPGSQPAPPASSPAAAAGAAAAAAVVVGEGLRGEALRRPDPPTPAAARARSSTRSRSAPRPLLPPPKVPLPKLAGTLSEPGAPPPRPPSSSMNVATRTVGSPPKTPATVTGSRPPKPQTSTSCRRPSCSRYFPICHWTSVAFLHHWFASTGVTFV